MTGEHLALQPAMEPMVLAVAGGANPPDLGPLEGVDIRFANADNLTECLQDADALLVWDFRATGVAQALDQPNQLRWVHVSSTGVDHVLTPTLRESNIVVTNTRGVLDGAIAEYVLGLVLAFAKDLPRTLQLQTEHRWLHRPTSRLAGSTALVIGPGSIGRHIASLLSQVGLSVDAVGRTARCEDATFGTIYAQHQLPAVAGSYDFLIVAAPLTEDTRGMVDEHVLRAMRSSARIINVARGPLIDEPALERALHDRRIAGAALDVFNQEPLPVAHSFWDAPNVIVSPHMAGDFFDWRADLLEVFLENLHHFRSGRPLHNVVDKIAGFVSVDAPVSTRCSEDGVGGRP